MPSYEMPLEQLRNYKGCSPCPGDFDRYWSDALAELDAQPCRPQRRPSAFQAPGVDCFDLFFDGVRGARVHAQLLIPKGKTGCPAVVQFHGYTSNAGAWYDKLGLAATGFVVAALDCRGQGGASQDPGGDRGATVYGQIVRGVGDRPENLFMRQLFLDAVQLARIVMELPQVDGGRVAAMGGSQGGGLSLACAALEPRIQKLAVTYPFLSDYRRAWQLNRAQTGRAYGEIGSWFRHFDPQHLREDAFFEQLGYIDVQNLAARIRAHTLMAITLQDEACPPSTQFAVYNRITAPKQLCLYPDWGHEPIPMQADCIYRFLTDGEPLRAWP